MSTRCVAVGIDYKIVGSVCYCYTPDVSRTCTTAVAATRGRRLCKIYDETYLIAPHCIMMGNTDSPYCLAIV